MRMTNEEFQAEVFRRSEVYLDAKKRSRKQIFRCTAAFAACFVLIGGGLVLLTKTKLADNMTASDMAIQSIFSMEDICENAAESLAEEEYFGEDAEDAADEFCPEAADGAASEAEAADAESDASADHRDSAENKHKSAASAIPELNDDNAANLTAAEYFEALEINQMPEILCGFFLQWAPDANFDLRGCNVFPYDDTDGKTALAAHVTAANENETDEIIIAERVSGCLTADFAAGKAHITLLTTYPAMHDPDALRAAAEELRAILLKQ